MAIYLVGKDDSSFFKNRTTWELLDAIKAAKDGDTIELEEGYCYRGKEKIILTKNINLFGHVVQKDDLQLLPTLFTSILIKNKAKVVLQNIFLIDNKEKNNVLRIKEESIVFANNVVINNNSEVGKMYPIIYMDEGSSLELNRSEIRTNNTLQNYRIFIESSYFKLNSSLVEARVIIKNSEFLIEDGTIRYHGSNSLQIKENSNGTIKKSNIVGGDADQDYPNIFIENSKVRMESTSILQPKYSAALYAKSSELALNSSTVDSIKVSQTSINIEYSCIVNESVQLIDSSLKGENLWIEGRENQMINLYGIQGSSILLKSLIFGNLTNPPMKFERNTKFEVPEITVFEYDTVKNEFIRNEIGQHIPVNIEPFIEYFGDKTTFEKLEDMVGLASVKRNVKEFIAFNKMGHRREAAGLSSSTSTLHALFLGNPGTGKTTVARLIGQLLKEEGLIEKGQFIETSRSDLIGAYIGQTELKTREVLESALGGILFIDEAYSLAKKDSSNDFGLDAINEILKFMEDHRRDIVIIFAGYTKEMEEFLEMNEGLRSRIPNTFIFEDYTVSELVQIGLEELYKHKYTINETKYAELVDYQYCLSNDRSNGRWIRNLNERLLKNLALYLMENPKADMNHIRDEIIDSCK
ncbi:AAA family ATPase [Streptococcus suis]|uniref:AAA family ATPase n=1 Tax=Streptococcus suis TaxID=1307 RepID=UPI000CF5BCC1|nr:AAA family ATPase [Streptococcus suis]